jgi:hypothetical protein
MEVSYDHLINTLNICFFHLEFMSKDLYCFFGKRESILRLVNSIGIISEHFIKYDVSY